MSRTTSLLAALAMGSCEALNIAQPDAATKAPDLEKISPPDSSGDTRQPPWPRVS